MREQNKTDLVQVSPLFQASMLVKIAAKEPKYDRESLIAEVIELLIAGTDTTAHTLSFTQLRLEVSQQSFISRTVTAEPFDVSIRWNASALSAEKVEFKLFIRS